GEEVEPGGDLSLIAQESREEAMEPGRHTTVDQGGEPRDRSSRRHEQKPDGEHNMLRHDEHDAKKRRQAATPKRFVAVHDETTVHARYRSECAASGLFLAWNRSGRGLRRQRRLRREGGCHLQEV